MEGCFISQFSSLDDDGAFALDATLGMGDALCHEAEQFSWPNLKLCQPCIDGAAVVTSAGVPCSVPAILHCGFAACFNCAASCHISIARPHARPCSIPIFKRLRLGSVVEYLACAIDRSCFTSARASLSALMQSLMFSLERCSRLHLVYDACMFLSVVLHSSTSILRSTGSGVLHGPL